MLAKSEWTSAVKLYLLDPTGHCTHEVTAAIVVYIGSSQDLAVQSTRGEVRGSGSGVGRKEGWPDGHENE